MTSTETSIFQRLAQFDSPGEVIDQMVDYFRQTEQPMELFEALKMKSRHLLGLPLIAGDHDEGSTPENVQRQLEIGLLDACREAGSMMIRSGDVRQGWMYLRPLGDRQLARELMSEVEVTDDNYEDVIQVLVHEAVDVGRGYALVLENQGTCNSITLYEQALVDAPKSDRQAAAAELLDHLYAELSELVKNQIIDKGETVDPDEDLAQMLEKRRWIMEGGGYHLDTTHIASTVRIASSLTDPDHLDKAWQLTQYGKRLHHQFQYPGEEPFVDFYPAYAAFYATLLGKQVEAGLKYFERKARNVDVAQHGTAAIETYIDLLDRVGRPAEAAKMAVELVPDDVPAQRLVPTLIEMLSGAEGEDRDEAFQVLLGYCESKNDILGYAAAIHARDCG
ncbi:MAG: hypothetical protein AAGA03_00300 [Planctomycetota bacterium]